MGNIQLLVRGFPTLFTSNNVGAALLGAVLGLVVGAVPGIGSLAGVALLPPLTYKFNPTTVIIALGALCYFNMYGSALSVVLSNIPGNSPAICTAIDDYPMASKRKRPGQALFTASMTSFVGGTIGIIILTFTRPALTDIGLKFDPSEMTALLLIAMTSINWLVGENSIKGVMMTMLDILLASIGMDTLSGSPRYNFGSVYLLRDIPFTPFIVGTMRLSQVTKLMMGCNNEARSEPRVKLIIRGSILAKHDLKHPLPLILRSGVIGASAGALLGMEVTTGVFMGHATQGKFKNGEELRTGTIEGIVVSEAANNAAAAGAFAPLLVLGVPGSGIGAVLLGGLMMQGLNPGPLLFTNEPEFTWGLIASPFLSSIFALVVAIGIIPFLIQILSVPVEYMTSIITIACMVGSCSSSYSTYGVLIMFLSGILRYLLVENDYPTASMPLSFVLAKLPGSNMRKAFTISGGSLGIFSTRPITCVLILILLAFICTPVIKTIFKKARASK